MRTARAIIAGWVVLAGGVLLALTAGCGSSPSTTLPTTTVPAPPSSTTTTRASTSPPPTSKSVTISPTPPTSITVLELPADGSATVPPGTACGASTGQPIVKVEAGAISCDEAEAVLARYRALPPDPAAGNTNTRAFDGWQCTSPTYASSQQLGYGTSCRDEARGVHLTTPVGSR
ncbi:hypothetical protein [Nocardia sp. NPDC057668]|uniref:hypothetical protein n=1 Tax=Nocardia sp. NPDC057668 TaxID=3346202 RepID=UPI00366B49B3